MSKNKLEKEILKILKCKAIGSMELHASKWKGESHSGADWSWMTYTSPEYIYGDVHICFEICTLNNRLEIYKDGYRCASVGLYNPFSKVSIAARKLRKMIDDRALKKNLDRFENIENLTIDK